MILDGFLLFSGTSNGASGGITASAYTDAPTTGTEVSSNVVDIGIASGIPTSANGGGGRDLGIGDNPSLKLLIQVSTAFVGGTNMAVLLAGAPDNGSGVAGSYVTMWTGPTVLEADLLTGAYLANVDVPRVVPGQAPPRFLRVSYVTSGIHSAGAVTAAIVLDRFDQVTGDAGVLSGYPAGINVAN